MQKQVKSTFIKLLVTKYNYTSC